jgi:maltooligosyltrehalose trehalohydrolase
VFEYKETAMNHINVLKREIGATYEQGTAHIRVWAPLANKMAIKLQDGTCIPMRQEDYGYWECQVNALPGTRYKFVLDDEKEIADPASLFQPEGVHGPSAIFDTGMFAWTDDAWTNPPLEDYIFYEIHTGTFTPAGTFKAIESKLDHLVACGITAIEIMPVSQFPGSRNWGYDGVFPFAVQDSYGGLEMLQRLVNKCHEIGLAVVLDVVYNHLGPEGNYLREFGPYFTNKYRTSWGDAVNFDDAWCDGVRRFFVENALMWFRDFHIDALRMDAVHAIRDFSPRHILKEIREYTDELIAQTGRRHYLVVECDLNDTTYINPVKNCGLGMDAQWNDEFHHALRVTAGNERNGYYEDFNGIEHLAKAYSSAYVFDGTYSPHRKRVFGCKAENAGSQFVVFSQNHDQTGNRMLGERTSALHGFEMLKLLAGAVMVSPYLPLLFMGEEWGATSPFQYFISHTDPELVMAVRRGRKAEFASFHHDTEFPDPQSEETFARCKLQWGEIEEERHQAILNYYTALIALRKRQPALRNLNRQQMHVTVDAGKQLLTVHRWHGESHVFCIMNFSQNKQQTMITHQYGALKKLFDSAAGIYPGASASLDIITTGTTLFIQPESLIIYCNEHV